MRIREARYVNGETVTVIALNQMTVRRYENHYQGKLFCPTPTCTARISFCTGPTPYYKTWRLDNHLDSCPHKFDRIPIKRGVETDEVISVDIGRKRRNDALSSAFKLSLLSDEEKLQLKERRKASRQSKQRTTSGRKVIKTSVQTTLFGGEEEERLKIKVIFEEAFIAEPENYAFLNNFHVPKRYVEGKENTIFNGIGEIRMKENQLMLVVYHGNDFRFAGNNMLALRYV